MSEEGQGLPRAIRYHAVFDSLQGDRARRSNSVYFFLPLPGDDVKAMAFAQTLERELIRGVLISLNKNLFQQQPQLPLDRLPSGTNPNGKAWQQKIIFADERGQVETMTLDYVRSDVNKACIKEIMFEAGLVSRRGDKLVRIVKEESKVIR